MKYCQKCGKEIMDEAVICPSCGSEAAVGSAELSPAMVKKRFNKKLLFLIIPAVILVIAGILAAMILPYPDLKMQDLKDDGYFGALFDYGVPSRKSDKGAYIYDKCIKFYGIPVVGFMYEAGDSCFMTFNADDAEEVKKVIRQYCKYEKTGLINTTYSYGDLEVTVDTGLWVMVKFN